MQILHQAATTQILQEKPTFLQKATRQEEQHFHLSIHRKQLLELSNFLQFL